MIIVEFSGVFAHASRVSTADPKNEEDATVVCTIIKHTAEIALEVSLAFGSTAVHVAAAGPALFGRSEMAGDWVEGYTSWVHTYIWGTFADSGMRLRNAYRE